MEMEAECRCCKEIKQVADRCAEASEDVPCMTLHPGFNKVTLNPWVLQAVYNSYRQQYGEMDHHTLHERYQYTAYLNFVRWCWGYSGKRVHVVLPACVVNTIREKFPSDSARYEGFELPKL
jgi:hypothetical protein